MIGIHRAAVRCLAVFNFTVANNGFLRLGGANQTVPTSKIVPTAVGTTWDNGIPLDATKTRLAELTRDTNGHRVKHVVIRCVSTAGAITGPGAWTHNAGLVEGIDPGAATGARLAVGDSFEIWNSQELINLFAARNNSGGNMEFDVEVYE